MSEHIEDEGARMVERIRKLLQHAAGEGHHSEEEVQSALRLARKLMDRYGVEEEAVMRERPEEVSAAIGEHVAYSCAREVRMHDKHLAQVLTAVCDVRLIWRWDGRAEHVVYIGLPRDCAFATALYKELLVTVRAMARMRLGKTWCKQHVDYQCGFAARLRERALAERDSGAGTAIVLLKGAIIDKWMAAKLTITYSKSNFKIESTDAYWAGHRDAERVQLRGSERGVTTQVRPIAGRLS